MSDRSQVDIEILAVIEAKKASFEPCLAQQQLMHYFDENR